jgi:hypothetical protein
MTVLFPCLSAALNLGAVVFYLAAKDYARATYWACACCLTLTVTFWIK